MSDDWPDFPWFGGQGSVHDLRDANSDPRNPRLAEFKSVSYAAAVAMGPNDKPKARKIGFFIPGRKRQ
jgi:hypothetical protein